MKYDHRTTSVVIILSALVFGSLTLTTSLLAAEGQTTASIPVLPERPIRADVKLALVHVSAIDSRNQLVTGLKSRDFQISEDGTVQKISYFSTEDEPISVGIVFDVSDSMTVKIDTSRTALAEFLRTTNPQDEFSLILFSDRPRLMFEFEHDTTLLLNQAIRTQPAGSTALYDAVYLGLSEMRKAKKPRKALLVISDGEDNHSRYTAEDIVRTAKESDTQIYTIGVHNPSVNIRYMREAELKDMARVSGGRYFRVENLDGLAEKARQISRELHSFYVLGYKPSNERTDGKWRKIRVELTPPDLRRSVHLYHRPGYYAPQSGITKLRP